jgi:hypothetical protein
VCYIDDPELAYVMQRYHECHHFYHCLTNLPFIKSKIALNTLSLPTWAYQWQSYRRCLDHCVLIPQNEQVRGCSTSIFYGIEVQGQSSHQTRPPFKAAAVSQLQLLTVTETPLKVPAPCHLDGSTLDTPR